MRIRSRSRRLAIMTVLATASVLVLSYQPVWADPDQDAGHGKGSYEHGKGDAGHGKDYGSDGHGYGGHGVGPMAMVGGPHNSAGHLLRHMLRHSKEIGLREEQITKLKELQLNLDKTRIKSEADIMVAERELRALVEDDKAELSAIESKLKESEAREVDLRMYAIKIRRDALAVLTPEQREKLKSEHKGMRPAHQMEGRGAHGGMRKDDGKRGHP